MFYCVWDNTNLWKYVFYKNNIFFQPKSVQNTTKMMYKKVALIEFRKLISFRDEKTYFLFFYEKNFQTIIFQKSIFRTSSETFKSGDFFENSVRRGLQLRSDQRVALIECLPYKWM